MYIKKKTDIIQCKHCEKEFSQNRSNQVFCVRKCKQKYLLKHSHKKKPYRKFKGNICDYCGFIPIDKCQLDVDHIDGNHKNNCPENLQTLCANCHRLKTKLSKDGPYNKAKWVYSNKLF